MTIDQLEELIRRLLAAGVAVVVVLVAPGTRVADPTGTAVVTVAPTPSRSATPVTPTPTVATPSAGPSTTSADRTGADGADPGSEATSTSAAEPTSRATTTREGTAATGPDAGPGETDRATSSSVPSASTPSGHSHPTADADSSGARSPATSTPSSSVPSTGAASAEQGTTAAATNGWGTPSREDDFSGGTEQWSIYDGEGHDGRGRRSPSAVSVADGVLTLTGDASGTTAGMAWIPGQRYGRWEGRVRAPAADPSYNALMLMWPDAENWPEGGELDFMEMTDPARQVTNLFLHYGADNSQVNGQVTIDATQWHNWAVEWTPEAVTAYVDGRQWYRTTDTSTFPPGPMHLCIQLDWFPEGGTPKESSMQVDWVRQYPLAGAGPSTVTATEAPSPVRSLLRALFGWG